MSTGKREETRNMGHRMISQAFWTDAWIDTLSKDERLLFLHLLTNPSANVSGIYECTKRRMSFETALEPAEIESALSRITADGKAAYVDGYVILKNSARHQSYKSSPAIRKGIEKELMDAPAGVLLAAIRLGYRYEYLNDIIEARKDELEALESSETPDSTSAPESTSDDKSANDFHNNETETQNTSFDNDTIPSIEDTQTPYRPPIDPQNTPEGPTHTPAVTRTLTRTRTKTKKEFKPAEAAQTAKPPDAGVSKQPSPMKDSLAQWYQELFIAQFPDSSWSNYQAERSQLNKLAHKTRKLLSDVPIEEETQLADALFESFLRLRKDNANSNYWRCAIVPTQFSHRWSAIIAELSEEYERHESIRRGVESIVMEDLPL